MVQIWFLTEGAREIESWGLVSPDQGDESRQDSKEDFGKVVLESWYYTRRGSSGIPGICGTIPGKFPTGCCWAPIPQKAAEEVLGGLELHQTLVGVVLEAWCYTRAAGTEVIHVAGTGFQGIPDCIARYNSPRMW